MRIAILVAGGIGGHYGGMLALSGHAVHLLARGENLVVLRKRGLEVRIPEDSFVVQVKAADDVREFGPIDWAIVTNCTSRSRQVLLGSGESLFTGLDLPSLGYRCVERVPSTKTTHVVLARS